LNLITSIKKGGEITIGAPDTPDGSKASRRLATALQELGGTVTIANGRDGVSFDEAKGATFLIGNLGDSLLVRELYIRFFCATDLTYPGPSGYELRTLADPFGSGHNVIHLGYSDSSGFETGFEALMRQLEDPLPYLAQLKTTRVPLPEHEQRSIEESGLPELDWQVVKADKTTFKGYLAYLNGDRKALDGFYQMWEAALRYGIPNGDHNIKDLHLCTSVLFLLFRLLEATGLIREDLRLPILRFFWDWTKSDQGGHHIDIPEFSGPGFPRQNHGLIPALALAYMADYFERYFPELEGPEEWRDIADRVYAPYQDGSWKHVCDGLCHGWYLSQPALLEYALLDPEHRYFERDGARKAAECAIAVVNNLGWLPSSGDMNLLRAFPGISLRTAAAWYRDGRYLFVHNLAPKYRASKTHVYLNRAFDTGITPVEPSTGLVHTVVSMDPLVYYAWDHQPEALARRFPRRPNIPLDRAFDKLSFRAGWAREDDYLLIDGLGGGSHAYADALDVIDYSSHGYSFLVSETGSHFPEPESHSVLTVVRDGEAEHPPCFAECLDASSEPGGHGYGRAALRELNGTDWVREVYFMPGFGMVIHDTVHIRKAGKYIIENHLGVPERGELEDGRFTCRRGGPNKENVSFRLEGTSSHPSTTHITERDTSLHYRDLSLVDPDLPPEENPREAWRSRYETEDLCVSLYTRRVAAELPAGSVVSFTHFARASFESEEVGGLVSAKKGRVVVAVGEDERVLLSKEPAATDQMESVSAVSVTSTAEISLTVIAEVPDRITCAQATPDGNITLGDANGVVRAISPSGKVVWTALTGPPIEDLAILEDAGTYPHYRSPWKWQADRLK